MDYIKTAEDLLREKQQLEVIKNSVINNYNTDFLNENYTELNLLKNTLNFARTNHIPVLLDDSAKLLIKVVSELKPLEILEIGTAIGYSGTLMLDASSNANLTTVEKNEDSYLKACKNFEANNIDKRVTAILGDAKDVIEELLSKNKKFDFIFLDGPKGQYIKYLKTLQKMLNVNGVLFADNVLFKNMVLFDGFIKHRKRTIVVNLRKYLYKMLTDNNYENWLLNIGDGVIISKKLKD